MILLNQYPVDTLNKFSCQITEACNILCNVQSDDKYENELKECGWDAYHMFLVRIINARKFGTTLQYKFTVW